LVDGVAIGFFVDLKIGQFDGPFQFFLLKEEWDAGFGFAETFQKRIDRHF
jgi:hypothetical protein